MEQRPKILYVATKEITYPRSENIIYALSQFSELKVICFNDVGNRGRTQSFRYLWRIFRVTYCLVKELVFNRRQYDVLVVGFFAQPIVPIARLFWSGTLVTDVFISFYDTLCNDRKIFHSSSLFGQLALWFDKYSIRNSDLVITDTDAHAAYLRKISCLTHKPIQKLYIGSKKISRKIQRDRQNVIFTVIFSGAFIPLQGSQYIVEAARIISHLPIKLIMFGTGQEHPSCIELAAKYNLRNLELLGWRSFNEVIESTVNADLALGIFGDTEKTKRVIPNKVFEAVSIGTPVLTGSTPAIGELFTPGHDILACETANPDEIAEKLSWAYHNRNDLVIIGNRGRVTLESRASKEVLAATLQRYFSSLL